MKREATSGNLTKTEEKKARLDAGLDITVIKGRHITASKFEKLSNSPKAVEVTLI